VQADAVLDSDGLIDAEAEGLPDADTLAVLLPEALTELQLELLPLSLSVALEE
jgi:hypothetical protein